MTDSTNPNEKPKVEYKVGDRVAFHHIGRIQQGIIRSFMFQDWSDEAVAVVDIEGPGRGPIGESLGVRIEQRRFIGKVKA